MEDIILEEVLVWSSSLIAKLVTLRNCHEYTIKQLNFEILDATEMLMCFEDHFGVLVSDDYLPEFHMELSIRDYINIIMIQVL